MFLVLNNQSLATVLLITAGAIVATPVLVKGFGRRGKGVFYEKNFLIQRAPQIATFVNVVLIVLGFFASNRFIDTPVNTLLSWSFYLPPNIANACSWLGIAVLISGLVFMIGGWYSLGDCFSTDAEVLDGHTVRKTGLLKYVMHPAYSGIIQTLIGCSLAAVSIPSVLFAVCVVAPLWLNRAKYEEGLLLQSLGPDYEKYAEELKWRRLVPPFIPIGV